jgi:hypothetical protein
MPAFVVKLTAAVQGQLCAFIRAGAYPHVAAEAAGVPAAVFDAWLEIGGGKRAPKLYRNFRRAVKEAQAQARAAAEMKVYADDPKTWLTRGPGKETPTAAGWSTQVKPLVQLNDNRTVTNLLSDPTMSALMTLILGALSDHPDARRAVIDALNSTTSPPKPPPKLINPTPPEEAPPPI